MPTQAFDPVLAAARPCLDVLRLAAKLTAEHKGGLTRLLNASMVSANVSSEEIGRSRGGAADDDAITTVEDLVAALLEVAGDARKGCGAIRRDEELQPTPADHERKRSGVADEHAVQEKRRTAVITHPNSSGQKSVRPPAAAAAQVIQDARAVVVGNADLLQHIMVMVAGPSKEARADLGHMGSVCRLWRVISRRNYVWRSVAIGLFPVLSLSDKVEDNGGVVCWEHVRRIGRGLVIRGVWDPRALWERLTLHVEMWDEMDGLRMLSASGPLCFVEHEDGAGGISIRRATTGEIVGPAFSASSRDSTMRRLGSIREYFERAHLPEYPTRLRVRAVITDDVRGRIVVVRDTVEDAGPCVAEDPAEWWQQRLPPESLYIASPEISLTNKAGRCLLAHWRVYISPASGQAADVHDSARLWAVAPTPPDALATAEFMFRATLEEVQAFILSALA